MLIVKQFQELPNHVIQDMVFQHLQYMAIQLILMNLLLMLLLQNQWILKTRMILNLKVWLLLLILLNYNKISFWEEVKVMMKCHQKRKKTSMNLHNKFHKCSLKQEIQIQDKCSIKIINIKKLLLIYLNKFRIQKQKKPRVRNCKNNKDTKNIKLKLLFKMKQSLVIKKYKLLDFMKQMKMRKLNNKDQWNQQLKKHNRIK